MRPNQINKEYHSKRKLKGKVFQFSDDFGKQFKDLGFLNFNWEKSQQILKWIEFKKVHQSDDGEKRFYSITSWF